MEYLKKNHLSLLIIAYLVFTSMFGVHQTTVVQQATPESGLAAGALPQDLTTLGNPYNFTNTKSPGGVTIASSTLTNINRLYSIGNVDYASIQQSFTATSSVPIVITNPYGTGATTSVNEIICQITTGSGGSITYDVSTTTATGGYGSSSPAFVYAHSVGSNAQDTMVWHPNLKASTSIAVAGSLFSADKMADGSSPFYMRPTESLTLRIATSTPGSNTYTGTCSVLFAKP